MRKICVVTGTRAEYGIMSGIMSLLKYDKNVCLQIIATNMHLSERFGMTVNEIIADGFTIDERVPLPLDDDSHRGTVNAMGVAMCGFSGAFSRLDPDLVVILGDRYEMLAAASAALIFGIPVAHLHGGEITEGAYDDSIRHAITKLATYHFTSTEEYRRRVIQMGEEPQRVFNSGSPAVDSIARFEPMAVSDLEVDLGISLADRYVVVTFHPVTMQPGEEERQTLSLLKALDRELLSKSESGKVKVILTLPNSDTGGRRVADICEDWCRRSDGKAIAVKSLGRKRYYSALAHAAAVVGNSSSGIIEAPSFGIPTLDIGDRQKGRTYGNTVFKSSAATEDIAAGLRLVTSEETRDFCRKHGVNPYCRDNAVDYIYRKLTGVTLQRCCPKHFFDIDQPTAL